MLNILNKNKINHDLLYNNILSLTRKKMFYTKLNLEDSFQNRIHLIFIHASFLFIKIKSEKNKEIYRDFYQRLFDNIFKKIELNMREIGYGDVSVNKNMKFLVKNFYSILLYCEDYTKRKLNDKKAFFTNLLTHDIHKKDANFTDLVEYFDFYQSFCLDLSSDSVLKGDLNFNYK